MAKNLIPEICKMLGVEVGEEFKLRATENGNKIANKYVIRSDGKLVELHRGRKISHNAIIGLLNGELEIVKLLWKPKEKEQYWSFITKYNDNHNVIWNVGDFIFRGNCYDCAALKAGWVYRTAEEAEAALPKVAKELEVEYEI